MDATRRLDTNSLVHLNNFIFLVFSLCTDWVYDHDMECQDKKAEGLLYFVLYGNLVVYGFIFGLQMLHVLNLLDTCSQKFGAVCITIHSFIFLGGVLIFDFLSMIYGIYMQFFSETSPCKELELFTMSCAYVFLVWITVMLIGSFSNCWNSFKGREEKNKYSGIL